MERGVEMIHRIQHRVHSSSVFQVAYEEYVQIVEPALCLVDRVEVEHRLRRMLVGTVASIHYGHWSNLRSIACSPFQIVTHDYDVGIVRYHHYGVLQRLSLSTARHLWVGESDDACPKTVCCRLKRQTRACAGLEKQGGYYSAFKKTTVGMPLEFLGHLNKILNFLTTVISNRYQTAFFHILYGRN